MLVKFKNCFQWFDFDRFISLDPNGDFSILPLKELSEALEEAIIHQISYDGNKNEIKGEQIKQLSELICAIRSELDKFKVKFLVYVIN